MNASMHKENWGWLDYIAKSYFTLLKHGRASTLLIRKTLGSEVWYVPSAYSVDISGHFRLCH